MTSTFEIVAEPTRRRILELLFASDRAVGDLADALELAQPAVSKHLRVLREAGLVTSEVDAQRRLYRLNAEPLREIDAWVAPFRGRWGKHLDALERHLDRMPDDAPGARAKSRAGAASTSRSTRSTRRKKR